MSRKQEESEQGLIRARAELDRCAAREAQLLTALDKAKRWIDSTESAPAEVREVVGASFDAGGGLFLLARLYRSEAELGQARTIIGGVKRLLESVGPEDYQVLPKALADMTGARLRG